MYALSYRSALVAVVFLGSGLFVSCSEDNSAAPGTGAGDYFPFGREYRWTYTTNIMAEKGFPSINFEMKIDTAEQNDRWYWFMLVRPVDTADTWSKVMGLKDAGNIVYSLGDNPPEGEYPLFQHSYSAAEAVPETITVQGKTYDALRVDHTFAWDSVKVSWWFAKDVGLIREYSERGGSLFTDDQWGDDVTMVTELVALDTVR